MSQGLNLGMGDLPPLVGNPYNGYINPYYWLDDHPLLYGNNGSLDPSTYLFSRCDSWTTESVRFSTQQSLEQSYPVTQHI